MPSKTLTLRYEEFNHADDLPKDECELVAKAWEARSNAYTPYSRFKVGAAVLTKDGQVITGSNQETANYKGSCAERVALDSTGAQGLKRQVAKIAIVGEAEDVNTGNIPPAPEEPVTPCGQCRQDIKEAEDLSGEAITIIMASRNKILRIRGIGQLLPFAFGPANLGILSK